MSDPHISPFKARLLREMAEDFSYELGNAALIHGHPDEAVVLYRRALEVKSDNAKVLGNLAVALTRTGDEAGAREALRRADATGQCWRGTAHFDLGRVHEVLGHHDEAEASFRRAVESDPEHVEALERLLHEELRRHNHEAALDLYHQVAQFGPWILSGQQKTEIGVLLLERDAFSEAGRLLEEAIAEGHGTIRGMAYRVVVLGCMEQFDAALRAVDDFIARFPEEPFAHIEKAKCLIAAGRFDEAAETLNNPQVPAGNIWVAIFQARIRLAAGHAEDAIARYRVLTESSQHPVPHLDLGMLLEDQGEAGAALELYDKAIPGVGGNPWTEVFRGSALEALGRGDLAAHAYRTALAQPIRENFLYQFVHDRAAARRKLARARVAIESAAV